MAQDTSDPIPARPNGMPGDAPAAPSTVAELIARFLHTRG